MTIELAAITILIIASVLLVFLATTRFAHYWSHWLTGSALIAALAVQTQAWLTPSLEVGLLTFDALTIALSQLALLIVLMIWLALKPWLHLHSRSPAVFYLLLLWLTIGCLVMIAANHFALLLLGLELLSLSLIGLIAFQPPVSERQHLVTEAAIKYLILSAIASATILLGFALLYIDLGSLNLASLSLTSLTANKTGLLNPWLVNLAIIFILVGALFKLSVVPCHLWFADLVQGAPPPVAALISTLPKLAMFVVLLRLFVANQWVEIAAISDIMLLVAMVSMLIGNILALRQQNIFRLLAYSSIAHFGYLLILINLNSNNSVNMLLTSQQVMIIYLSAYLLALTAIFTVLMQSPEQDTVLKLQGLLWQQPCRAITLIVLILSLAGIPLTFGFVAKLYLVLTSINNQQWYLLTTLCLGSIISLFYYFNLIISLSKPSNKTGNKTSVKTSLKHKANSNVDLGSVLLYGVIITLVLGFGFYPGPVTALLSGLFTG